jgi:hypothetical protein
MINKNFIPILKIMKKLSGEDLNSFLDHLNDTSIDNVCECIFNVVNTDLKLSKAKRLKLRNHVKKNCCLSNIKRITNRKVPIYKRRKALQMEGRGLPLILASVIPFLTSLFTRKKHQ